MIKLFSYPTSPYAQKVGCYLKYKQLDYQFVPVNPLSNEQIRFTQQRQVPVLMIDDEWRKDSSKLGVWLDERYPQNPIVPSEASEREQILNIDQWISDELIPGNFRHAVEWQNTFNSITNGWRLARAVNDATPLPLYVRAIWPYGVKRVKFIVNMVQQMDLSESIDDMTARLTKEFIQHLDDGDFLGGRKELSLADLSAFPIVMSGYLMGMRVKSFYIDTPEIREWAKRIQAQLPTNPLLVPDRLLKRSL